MFNDVTDRSATLLPRGQYMVKVQRFESAEGQFGPQVKWVFAVADGSGQPVRAQDGQPVELWQFTTKNLTKHPKNKTRPWAEALLGRSLKEGESGAEIAQQLVGKKAMAFIDEAMNSQGKMRNNILQVWPVGGNAPAAPEPSADDEIPF